MIEPKKRLLALISEGEKFTYASFATRSEYGYPDAYKPEWIAWTARCKSTLQHLVGAESAPSEMLLAGLRVQVLGNGSDKFENAKAHLLGALSAAVAILDDDLFRELQGQAIAPGSKSNRVFIVHGHDDLSKTSLEALLRELGLDPVVLHRQPDEGHTVIEKLEKYSDVGYAFILLTPDEVAYLASDEAVADVLRKKERRSRPNVLFEFGFFVGRLGRQNVCCLHTSDVALPSDVAGLLYKRFIHSIDEVAYSITKELRARGYVLK